MNNAKIFSPFLKCILEEIINRSAQQTAIAHKAISEVSEACRFGQLRQIVDLAIQNEKLKPNTTLW
ncbi:MULTISPECIES: hypothetical protein, partial [unclassified Carboxylicivirga]|uniref:hypothetical protein n=1 Tax=Carboxylicivirga TaxID=1628153 RepID=UPI003D339492